MVMMATGMMMIMVGMAMVTMVMMIAMMVMVMMMVMTHCSKLSRSLATWGSKSQAHWLTGFLAHTVSQWGGRTPMGTRKWRWPTETSSTMGLQASMQQPIRQCNRGSHSTHSQWHSHNSSKGLLTSMQQSHPTRRRPLHSSSRV